MSRADYPESRVKLAAFRAAEVLALCGQVWYSSHQDRSSRGELFAATDRSNSPV
jgi:hypothetical protein